MRAWEGRLILALSAFRESRADPTQSSHTRRGSYLTSAKLCVGWRKKVRAGTSIVDANSTLSPGWGERGSLRDIWSVVLWFLT